MAEKQSKDVKFWCEQIAIYEREFRKWEDRSRKIIKRYKDERADSDTGSARFNILWSNIQTLAPSLFAKNPVPNVDRRFEDEDKIGTTAARVLERATTYFIDTDLFNSVMKQAVLDRLLPGRGVAWVRYCPVFSESPVNQVTDDVKKGEEIEGAEQELYSEDVVVDYVHWADYGHTWGRTDEEVRGKWRKVYLSRDQLKKRFGPIGAKVPLDKEDKKDEERIGDTKKACIYEIWDKTTKKVIWLHKEMPDLLDKIDDPLHLKDFFPCPKPLYSTIANDSLIPTPDYIQYQDQARELDNLTGRIDSITKSLKVAGIYDSSAEGLDRLLAEGIENKLIPVSNWALYAERGGLTNTMSLLPIQEIAQVLVSLYESRDRVKQDLYEITGISDIIRGATDPNETLGAQQLKGQFATLRLDDKQGEVARFSRDLVRITAQIIAEHFDLETIKQISAVKLLTNVEKQQLTAVLQSPQAQSQPVPDEIQELMEQPTWEEIEALLRDDMMRCFRISIETDSTIKQDQEAEKQARTELISAVTTYFQAIATIPPVLQPLAAELLQFGVKGYKVSRELEATFDVTLKKIKQQSENPMPQPDPETEKAKLEQQKMAMERDKMAQEKNMNDQKFQLEQEKLGNERLNMRLEAKTKVQPDVALSDPDMNDGQVTPLTQMINENMNAMAQMMAQGLQQLALQQAEGNRAILAAVMAPKKTEVIRGPDGRIQAGVSKIEGLQ